MSYDSDANEAANRIYALIPTHPEILNMDDPWDLFKIQGLNIDDLGLSAFQASWALANAKKRANTQSTGRETAAGD